MDGSTHSEGAMNRQREAPRMTVVQLATVAEIKELLAELGSNRLNEKSFTERMGGSSDDWLDGLQSRLDNKEMFACKISEGERGAGFVLADKDGMITRFYSPEGKEEAVLEKALYALKDKGISNPSVRLKVRTEKGKQLRETFHKKGFDYHEEEGEENDGKVGMRKH